MKRKISDFHLVYLEHYKPMRTSMAKAMVHWCLSIIPKLSPKWAMMYMPVFSKGTHHLAHCSVNLASSKIPKFTGLEHQMASKMMNKMKHSRNFLRVFILSKITSITIDCSWCQKNLINFEGSILCIQFFYSMFTIITISIIVLWWVVNAIYNAHCNLFAPLGDNAFNTMQIE